MAKGPEEIAKQKTSEEIAKQETEERAEKEKEARAKHVAEAEKRARTQEAWFWAKMHEATAKQEAKGLRAELALMYGEPPGPEEHH